MSRRKGDTLKESIAGIVATLLMFVVGGAIFAGGIWLVWWFWTGG